jgi:tetrapyrrole methylase family protein / MazG family protein
MPQVTVVGLGPAGPELITEATLRAIAAVPVRFVRTTRHPAAAAIPGAESFDHRYQSAGTIDEAYAGIVEDLVVSATVHGRVLYGVPGSPAVAERTVELLRDDPRIEIEVLPALSCLDLAWVRLGVDPLAAGATIVDGHRFSVEAAGQRGPLLVLQCDRPDVLSDIKLSVEVGGPVMVLSQLGLADERIETIAWRDLDRVRPDHLTTLWIPELADPVGRELVRFDELVRTLRQRCPWDHRQTHVSLRRYLVEEAYEVVDAIDAGDDEHLEEELGDLLFQVYFHATLAAEDGLFTLADVARGIHDKLVRRHPHIFGDATEPADWDALKQQEHADRGVMDGLPAGLPALLYAEKVQRRAATTGFDWDGVDGAWLKVMEEVAEVQGAAPGEVEGEIGDLLFACVNVARHLDVDPELALRAATAKFRVRFAAVERLAEARGIDVGTSGLAALDLLWDEVKDAERGGA